MKKFKEYLEEDLGTDDLGHAKKEDYNTHLKMITGASRNLHDPVELTKDENESIHGYIHGNALKGFPTPYTMRDPKRGFEVINEHLRGHNVREGKQKDKVESHIANIDSAISKHKTKEDAHVWRGIVNTKEAGMHHVMYGFKKGDVITDKGFLSTTTDPNHANAFTSGGGDIVHIKLPKGSKALSTVLHPQSRKNDWNQEHEVILPRNSKFRYIGKIKHKYDPWNSITIHHLEHIPEESNDK